MKPITWKGSRVSIKIIYLFMCILFNDAASNPEYMMSNSWMTVTNELEGTWNEAILSKFEGTISALAWNWRKRRETSVRRVDLQDKIRIGYFPKASQTLYRLSQLAWQKCYVYQIEVYFIKWTMPNIILFLWLKTLRH
jgi:hypothetical protein